MDARMGPGSMNPKAPDPTTIARTCARHVALFLLALGAAGCAVTLPHKMYVPYVPKTSALELIDHEGEQGLVSRETSSSVVVRVDSNRPWNQASFEVYVLNRSPDQAVPFGRSTVVLEARRGSTAQIEDKQGGDFVSLPPLSPEEMETLHGKLVSRERRSEKRAKAARTAGKVFTAVLVTALVLGLITLCVSSGNSCHGLSNLGRGKREYGKPVNTENLKRNREEQARLLEAVPRVLNEHTIGPGDAVLGDFWFKPPSWRPTHYELVIRVGDDVHHFPYRVGTSRRTHPKSMIRPVGSPRWPKPMGSSGLGAPTGI